MADVRYIITVTIPTSSDANTVTAMENVDITPVLSERADQFTLCSDVTAVLVPGTVRRTIIATLNPDFEAKFNGDPGKALMGAFKNRFAQQLPARVTESVNVGAFCP